MDEIEKKAQAWLEKEGLGGFRAMLPSLVAFARQSYEEGARSKDAELATLRAKHYAASNELRVAVERLRAAPPLPVDRPGFPAAYSDWLAKRRLVPLPAVAEREDAAGP